MRLGKHQIKPDRTSATLIRHDVGKPRNAFTRPGPGTLFGQTAFINIDDEDAIVRLGRLHAQARVVQHPIQRIVQRQANIRHFRTDCQAGHDETRHQAACLHRNPVE